MRTRLTLMALAAMMLGTTTSFAETFTVTDIKAVVPGFFELNIPSLEATDTNVTEAQIREIFNTGIIANAEVLAGLDATSISIPKWTWTLTVPKTETEPGGEVKGEGFDILLIGVQDGLITSFSEAGETISYPGDGEMVSHPLGINDLDLPRLFRLFGLVGGEADAAPEQIYSSLTYGGFTLKSKDVDCNVTSMEVGAFKARPLKTSFADMAALFAELEGKTEVDPTLLGKAVKIYADALTAFETGPSNLSGLTCSGKDDKGNKMDVAMGAVAVDASTNGIVPAMSLDSLKVDVENDGWMHLGKTVIKASDIAGVIATLQSAPDAVESTWFETNYRKLIPAFEGFSIADMSMDIPDTATPGARIEAEFTNIDLTLGNYRNGIPTDISNSIDHFRVPVPPQGEEAQMLRDAGLTTINGGYGIKLNWNEAESLIRLDDVSFSVKGLGSMKVQGTIGNASATLFDDAIEVAAISAMGLKLKDVQIDLVDDGMAKLALARAAAEQGQGPEAVQESMAGLVEGTLAAVLAGSPEATTIAEAISAFIKGNPYLSVTVTSVDPAGLGLTDFMAAEQDPFGLVKKVTIKASNVDATDGKEMEISVEEPATEAPIAEEPAVEEPVAEEPVVEEPVAEEPAPESTVPEGRRNEKAGEKASSSS